MSEAAVSGRRMGGRAARHKLRAAPLREEEKAVRPGMIGGRYRPLDESEVQRIHAAALDALERIGLSEAIPSCIEAVTAAGGELTPDGRLGRRYVLGDWGRCGWALRLGSEMALECFALP